MIGYSPALERAAIIALKAQEKSSDATANLLMYAIDKIDGETFIEHLTATRLRKARELLRSTLTKSSEILTWSATTIPTIS